MTKATAYVLANQKYLGAADAELIASLTDAQFDALCAADCEYAGAHEPEPGLSGRIVKTFETLADFDNSRATSWRERGERSEVDCAGRPAIYFERLQLHKGAERRNMIVVDLGDFRLTIS